MYFRITEIILNRQRSPWFWPDVLFNTLGQGQEHDKLLKILHGFTESVRNFIFRFVMYDYLFYFINLIGKY